MEDGPKYDNGTDLDMRNVNRPKHRKVRIEQVTEEKNLIMADRKARKGKWFHRGVREFDKDPAGNLLRLGRQIDAHEYHTSPGTDVEQYCPCGKVRLLHKLPYYPDHVEHHALMQVVMPTMKQYYYHDSSASIPGRGMLYAAHRTEHYIDAHKRAGRLYYSKLDFVKFYHNIDQQLCFRFLCSQFGNSGIRYLLWEAVTACDKGLGIGLYPIQPIANFYTSPLCRMLMMLFDMFVEIYCDDIVIISRDKKQVWKAVNFTRKYADEVMCQPLHEGYGVQIIDNTHFLDFVGYKFYFNHTELRNRMKKKMKRKLAKLRNPLRRYQVMVSYRGWLMHCDGFNLWRKVTGMKSFKDLNMPKVERRDRNGHRILDGQPCKIEMILDHEVEFHDVEYGLQSRYKPKDGEEPREVVVVQIVENCHKLKFQTSAPGIIDALRYAQEQGEWPIRGTIRCRKEGNFSVYEIE